jgi:predicted enzyme related to lactoylglutathione lyase
MPNLDRRKILHAGVALAVPFGVASLFGGCQQSTGKSDTDNSDNDLTKVDEPNKSAVNKTNQQDKGNQMQLQYLEIVTTDADALCKQYSSVHGVTFGEPDPNLGNARTAELSGGVLAIRGPMREGEAPVIRPYMLVENLEEAVAAAASEGAEVALPKMEIPGHGTIAIVIQGGIECGFWQA